MFLNIFYLILHCLGVFCLIGLLCVYFGMCFFVCVLCFISICEHYFFLKKNLIFGFLFICLFSIELDKWGGIYDQEEAEVLLIRIYYLKKINSIKEI